ncbi:MAG: hypothetical protein ACLP6G_01435 [Terriglobales bacterium]
MSIYPSSIARCQHIKVNGTQCGSPALKSRRLCFFHNRWREARIEFCQSGAPAHAITSIELPVLEDANSVQVAIMQVLRLILAKQLEPKIAGLLLYGLQTASLNLKRTRFEPYQPDVVIEPRRVAGNPLGEHAWDPSEYVGDDDLNQEAEDEEQEMPAMSEAPIDGAGASAENIDEAAMRAQLAGKEKLLALPTKNRDSASSSEPSLATLLATLVKLEQMQKSP